MKPGELERSIARLAAVARTAQAHLATASRELARLARGGATAGGDVSREAGAEPARSGESDRGIRADHSPTEATFK